MKMERGKCGVGADEIEIQEGVTHLEETFCGEADRTQFSELVSWVGLLCADESEGDDSVPNMMLKK